MKKINISCSKNPVSFVNFFIGWLIALGIIAAINNPEMFLQGFLLQ